MRKALHYAGLTTDEMAEYLGASPATLSRWLNMKGPVNRASMRLWALRTGVQLEWLEHGKGAPLGDGPDDGLQLPRLDSNQEPSGYTSVQVSGLGWAA